MPNVKKWAAAGAPKVSVLVAIADEGVYVRDLFLSAKLPDVEIVELRNSISMASSINAGLEHASSDLVVCAHQDVFFNDGWLGKLLLLVATAPPTWGVLGPAGTAMGGKMYGTHSGLGMDGYEHVTAQTLDGSCLIFKKSSGLRLDEGLTRFHMYDIDVCLQAKSRGLGVFVINLPMEHRTKWTAGGGFSEGVSYVQQKWKAQFPIIYTTVGTL